MNSHIEFPGVQLSWKRILAIAQDQPDPIVAKHAIQYDDDEEEEDRKDEEQTTFNRMQCMNKALHNVYTITSQDHGYVAFMITMAAELKLACPISMAFLYHVIDFSEIPTKQTLENVTLALLNKATTKQTKINATVIWSMLAQKFAGSSAESIWTNDLANMLIQSLHDDTNMYSLLALESFALTGTLKKRLMDQFDMPRILQQLLHKLDKSELISTHATHPTLVSIYHDTRIYKKLKSAFKSCKSILAKKRKSLTRPQHWNYKTICNEVENFTVQIHKQDDSMIFFDLRKLYFCLSWSLNNVFTRSSIHAPIPHQKTFLQPIDTNSHCKLSIDHLEVRNDTFCFKSVRATTGISSSTGGKWYYEVILLTDGIMQIGWGTKKCLLSSQDGSGVGDDKYGFAFDPHRRAVWAGGDLHSSSNATLSECNAGDVLGCLLDLDQDACTFFINGKDYGFNMSVPQSATPYYPTISLTGHQHVAVNFGDRPWYYNIHGTKAVSNAVSVTKVQTAKDQQSPHDTEGDDEEPVCNICYSEPINTQLYPCGHDGFGENCAQAFKSCPFCRSIIEKILVQ